MNAPSQPGSGDPSFPAAPPPVMPPPPPPVRPPPRGSPALGCAFAISLLLNLAAILVIVLGCVGLFFAGGVAGDITGSALTEKHHSGNTSSKDKVAIVYLDGIIMEGTLSFVHKQIEQAAKDNKVKAVVFRINSPGGSITASEDLHHRLIELRDGNKDKKYAPKTVVVSMASLAASGGYYVAMPGKKIYAERTTLTGSIGVYMALLNVEKLAKDHGVFMNLIKAGKIKDSGSMFKQMTPEEQRVWQDMINTAYLQFLEVVEKGRPELTKAKLLERFDVKPVIADPIAETKDKGENVGLPAPYQRYRADGGVWTAEKAKELGLIDDILDEEQSIVEVRKLAHLAEDTRVIQYEKPKTLPEMLLGVRSRDPMPWGGPGQLSKALMPRMWYLAPGYDVTGLLATLETD